MTRYKREWCPLCKGARWATDRFGLLRCDGCGLVVNPAIFQPGAAETLNEVAFGESYEPETSFWVRWFAAWKSRRYVRTIRRHFPGAGRLLEVGVGSGRFLEAARAAGFDVMGCDLSAPLCRRVEQRFGVEMHCGPVESLPSAQFDVVAMHHVLEHVEDPVGFLCAVRDVLKPGGIVHIAAPNVACWEARFRGWNGWQPYHVAYFDHLTLTTAVREAGLVPVSVQTHESFSAWFLVLTATMLQAKQRNATQISQRSALNNAPLLAILEHPYRLAMVTAGLATWPLRRVQAALGRGDELWVVARKAS